jgi:hypothetical protein
LSDIYTVASSPVKKGEELPAEDGVKPEVEGEPVAKREGDMDDDEFKTERDADADKPVGIDDDDTVAAELTGQSKGKGADAASMDDDNPYGWRKGNDDVVVIAPVEHQLFIKSVSPEITRPDLEAVRSNWYLSPPEQRLMLCVCGYNSIANRSKGSTISPCRSLIRPRSFTVSGG